MYTINNTYTVESEGTCPPPPIVTCTPPEPPPCPETPSPVTCPIQPECMYACCNAIAAWIIEDVYCR